MKSGQNPRWHSHRGFFLRAARRAAAGAAVCYYPGVMERPFGFSAASGDGGEFPPRSQAPAHALFLQWLIFAFVLAFILWLAWEHELVQDIFRTDPTKLSIVIALIFAGGTVHCALRSVFLSAQLNELGAITANPGALRFDGVRLSLDGAALASSPVSDYLAGVFRCRGGPPGETDRRQWSRLDDMLAEEAGGAHATGWFFAQLLIKLGLLGTVIGFILMLSSITGTASFEPEHAHELFSEMTRGMRVALNTTLVGLLGTILLGFQYLLLDRGADRLVAAAAHFAETHSFAR